MSSHDRQAQRRPYRIPFALRDLVLVDVLELTGSTKAAAAVLAVSQSSVSRRYSAVAADLGLQRRRSRQIGRRYGDTPWLSQLRRGVNGHRLACGVLRIGGEPSLAGDLAGGSAVEWVSLSPQAHAHWPQLLQQELLDAVVLPRGTSDRQIQATHDEPALPAWLELRPWSIAGSTPPLLLACRRERRVLELARCLDG